MNYYEEKAKRMYELYLQGKPCKKVYGAVHKGNYFIVLKNDNKKWKYQLAGGGVENKETNEQAIVREVLEELNIQCEIVRSLGVLNYQSNWSYQNKEFTISNEAEIFLLNYVSAIDSTKIGLDGEFSNNTTIALISKNEMLANVYEFASGMIKLK